MYPVDPAKPVAPYIGGKSKLARTIVRHIDAISHKAYCEAFVGMGGVFFRRHSRPNTEVINDYNGEVANFFRILNEHYQPFIDLIKWRLTTRREFNRMLAVQPHTLTDLQRAARFLYLQRLAFGGKVSGNNFGIDPSGTARFNLSKLVPLLEDAHERLSGVVIENLDYKDFIRRYDRAGTLFYLDPPYYGNENDYGQGLFSRAEFDLMMDLLDGIKGAFILSLNDRKEVRHLFKNFHQLSVSTTYSIVAKGAPLIVGELLISNVPLKNHESC